MAVTVLKNISRDEINWYHETRYWMYISDEKSMISSAEERGLERGMKQGLQQGIKQGIQQGAQQQAIETAINMLKKKYPVDEIADLTGHTVEKVLELQSQLPKEEKN